MPYIPPVYFNKHYGDVKKTGRPSLPSIVAIEPTYKCNLSCSMCFYDKKNFSGKELGAEDFIEFLKGLLKLSSVYFPSKEPLMKKDFFRICFYLSKRNIPMWLLTNGTLINKKNISSILYNKNNTVMVSLDGDKELHNRIRGSNSAYDRTAEAVRLLKDGCDLYAVCVISGENLNSLWKLPETVGRMGLKRMVFEYERKYTRKNMEKSLCVAGDKNGFLSLRFEEKNAADYSFNELKTNIDRMEKEAARCGIAVRYLPSYFKEEMWDIYHLRLRKKYKLTCYYLNKARIDPAGNCIHCFAFRRSFGNIKEKPLREIWFSDGYIDFRKKLLENNLAPICDNCWGAIPVDSEYGFKL